MQENTDNRQKRFILSQKFQKKNLKKSTFFDFQSAMESQE